MDEGSIKLAPLPEARGPFPSWGKYKKKKGYVLQNQLVSAAHPFFAEAVAQDDFSARMEIRSTRAVFYLFVSFIDIGANSRRICLPAFAMAFGFAEDKHAHAASPRFGYDAHPSAKRRIRFRPQDGNRRNRSIRHQSSAHMRDRPFMSKRESSSLPFFHRLLRRRSRRWMLPARSTPF